MLAGVLDLKTFTASDPETNEEKTYHCRLALLISEKGIIEQLFNSYDRNHPEIERDQILATIQANKLVSHLSPSRD